MLDPKTLEQIESLSSELVSKFTPPEYIPGCEVVSIADKDQYATDNGWIDAVVSVHNQQRCRWRGEVANLIVGGFVDVVYYPSYQVFLVAGASGAGDMLTPVRTYDELDDTPPDKTGKAGQIVVVNAAETEHEYTGNLLQTPFTSLITGGLLSVTSATTYEISEGTGRRVDYGTPYSPTAPNIIDISWSTFTGQTVASGTFTSVAIDSTGSVVTKLNATFTRDEWRQYVVLGAIIHDGTTITNYLSNPVLAYNAILMLVDYMNATGGALNGGQITTPNTNLTFDQDASTFTLQNINYDINPTSASSVSHVARSAAPFRYNYQDGLGDFQFATPTGGNQIDPANWDDGTGTLNSMLPNQWSWQPVFYFGGTNELVICYSQFIYGSKSLVEEGVVNDYDEFILDPTLLGAQFMGYFLLKSNGTDLSDPSDGEYVPAGQGGGGGVSGDYITTDGTTIGATSQAQDFGDNGVKADTLAESTAAAGVTVDGALLKDSDAFLISDEESVKNRIADYGFTASITDHFDSDVFSGWTWATYTGFVTPAQISMGQNSRVRFNLSGGQTVPSKAFAYQAYNNSTIISRCIAGALSQSGIRADDGTNTNYVDLFLVHNSTTNLLDLKYTSSAANATLVSGLPHAYYLLRLIYADPTWFFYYSANEGTQALNVASLSNPFTPARSGMYYQQLTGSNNSSRHALFDWIAI